MLRVFFLAAVMSLAAGTAAPQAEPPRPLLESQGDHNDWSAYYDNGVDQLRRNPALAGRFFYWATRLAPDQAEPLYAQWVAFWMVDEKRWIGYLRDWKEVLEALLRQLRREDEASVVRVYQSKELVLYSIGLLHAHRRRPAQARVSLREALVENLAFAPAHRALAALARDRGDTPTAVAELREAVELDPDDPVLRFEYGNALHAAGQSPAALAELRLAIAREPWWAGPYLSLGEVLEATGARDQAALAYQMYLSRAPGNALLLPTVRSRLRGLTGKP